MAGNDRIGWKWLDISGKSSKVLNITGMAQMGEKKKEMAEND